MNGFRDFFAGIAEGLDDFLFYNNLYDHSGRGKFVDGVEEIIRDSKYEVLVCCDRLSVPLGSMVNTSYIDKKLQSGPFSFSLVTTPKTDIPGHISRLFSYPGCFYHEVPKVDLSLIIADKCAGAAIKESNKSTDYRIKFFGDSDLAAIYMRKFYNTLKTGKRIK